MAPLPRSFFERDADEVAHDLVGAQVTCYLRGERAPRAARVTETEAYFGPPGVHPRFPRGDAASHAFRGPTPRASIMFGRAGHAYVYLVYGVHECFNVVTGAEGDGQAVLIRAVEGARGPALAARALGVTRADNGRDVTRPPLCFRRGEPVGRVVAKPRVGVSKARSLRLRFVDSGVL